ncbi:MAG: hypothetical protein PSX36_11855 [bacterium]|nr:hypothetical protein [bacterium]
MHKKDYIQRQFEEFGRVLALILGSKKQKDWEKFEIEIDEAIRKFTSLEIDAVEKHNDEEFEKVVIKNPALSQEQRKILANLLFEKLEFYLQGDDLENFVFLKQKCLALYSYLQDNATNNEFDLDVHYKLEILKEM